MNQIFIDASLLKDGSCFRRIWWRAALNRQPEYRRDNYKLAFANALHYFMESYYKDFSVKDSIIKAINYYKPWEEKIQTWSNFEFRSTTNLMKICKTYAKLYPRDVNDLVPLSNDKGEPTVEYKFSVPYFITPNGLYQIFLCGTLDIIAAYQGYKMLLVDHKTDSFAGKTEETRQNFFDSYEMNIQTMFYSWMYKRELALDFYPPVMINGIFPKKPTVKAADENRFDGVIFQRSPIIEYSNEQMENFQKWLVRKLGLITEFVCALSNDKDEGSDVYELAACNVNYGRMCEYFNICKLPEKFHKAQLENKYVEEQYNPLAFRD